MKLNVQRVSEDFRSAAKNQAAFDLFYYDFFGRSARDYGFLPRPALWLNKNPSFLAMVRMGSGLIRFLWHYLACLYLFARLVRFMVKRERFLPSKTYSKKVVLSVCRRSVDVIVQAESLGERVVWMAVPGYFNFDKDGSTISALSVLNWKELVISFVAACKLHFYLASEGEASILFQSYTALDWVITFGALTKIAPSKIITAEHHDRWAVLLDSYCEGVNKSGGDRIEFVLVQHGLEFESTYEKMIELGLSKGLPYKLKNLKVIYVYDFRQLEVFKRFIVCERSFCLGLLFRFYSYKLPLVETGVNNKTVLIIGNVACEAFHLELYLKLNDIFSFTCFYKPHPVLGSSSNVISAGWIFIVDKDYFPLVDLVVSYPSTLANEYEAAGVKVIEHAFDADCADIRNMITVMVDELMWPRNGV